MISADAETMRRAIALGDYFLEHAEAAISRRGQDDDLRLAQKVERWLRSASGRELARKQARALGRRELTTYVRGMRADDGSLDRVLELLTQAPRGQAAPLRVVERDGQGRIRRLAVHPCLLQGA